MIPENVSSLIVWLLSAATPGAMLSWLVEKVPAFQKLSPLAKLVLMLVFAAVFGGLAAVLQFVLADAQPTTKEALDFIWIGVMTGVLFLTGNQSWHAFFNKVRLFTDSRLLKMLAELGASENLMALAQFLRMVIAYFDDNVVNPPVGAGALSAAEAQSLVGTLRTMKAVFDGGGAVYTSPDGVMTAENRAALYDMIAGALSALESGLPEGSDVGNAAAAEGPDPSFSSGAF